MTQTSCQLVSDLHRRLLWLEEKNYPMQMSSEKDLENGIERIIICLECEEQDQSDRFLRFDEVVDIMKYQVAEGLAEYIIAEFEEKLLWKEIKKTHKRVRPEDQEVIYHKSVDILRNVNKSENLTRLLSYGRKNRMIRRIQEHMEDHSYFFIEGFVNFCLQDYVSEVHHAVESAQEEIKNEKEYSEFVNLLRFCAESQMPKITEVNLMITDKGKFYLWDGKGKEIKEELMSIYLDEILLDEINLDDALVSILLTLSPHRIVFHGRNQREESEPLAMIRKVFKDRITECTGCEKCLAYFTPDIRSEDQ
jgi:putative sporulation protein YtxC